MSFTCTTLDQFLESYGAELASAAERTMQPLHVPGRDGIDELPELLRKPFDAQAHLSVANAKLLNRDKTCAVIAEMGSGKTIIAQAIVETHQRIQAKRWHKKTNKPIKRKRAYRAIVMCPGTLVDKWRREILETIPNVRVVVIRNWRQMCTVNKREGQTRPPGATWYVIGRDTAKLSCQWEEKFVKREHEPFIRCPGCGHIIKDDDEMPRNQAWVKKARRQHCCGEQLWQDKAANKRNPKFSPALYIKKKMQGFFDYFIVDEVHEAKGADSIQANAMGWLAGASKRTIALTGTLIGGYAWHVRTLLFRMGLGRTLLKHGMTWNNETQFNETYGRIETKIIEVDKGGDDDDDGTGYRQGRGKSKSKRTQQSVRPGIMPTLFGDLLVNNCTFLSLDEVADNLPRYLEDVISVPLDGAPGLASAYKYVEKRLTDAITSMVRNGNKKMLGTMLAVLLCYPDYPFDWKEVGYYDEDPDCLSGRKLWIPVVQPENLDAKQIYPKEQALLDALEREYKEGRQCWVYTTFTGKRDVAGRLEKIIRDRGYRVKVLRAAVPPEEREEWINHHGPNYDVIISHPELVKVGLDFFDKNYTHNFCTILFYETGYNMFTLAQASRRAWRIGQRRECRTYYFVYADSMQARAMVLMGQKASAAQAVTGRFSSEGLEAMASEDGSLEMEMARQLADCTQAGDPTRAWEKLTTPIGVHTVSEQDLADLEAFLQADFNLEEAV